MINLKTPNRKELLQLGRVTFLLICISTAIYMVYTFLSPLITSYIKVHEQQLIDDIGKRQEQSNTQLILIMNQKFKEIDQKIDTTKTVLMDHIVSTEKDNRKIQQSIHRLYSFTGLSDSCSIAKNNVSLN